MMYANVRNGVVANLSSEQWGEYDTPVADGIQIGMSPTATDAELAAAQAAIQAAAACQAIDKKTSDLINRGHIYAGKVFSTSQSAQNNALAVSAMISRGVDFTGTVLSNIDNTDEHIVINNADMQEFADSCMNHIAYHKRIGGNLKKIIRDAEDPSTVEDNR